MIEDAGLRFEDRTLGKALPSILVDPTRFSQVLLNLLSNAIKYNRPKGVVAIDVEEILPTGMVKILISDTGPGVAPEDMGQLFEPFNRLGAEMTDIEGTGIGLAISKRLVELMGGRIEVASDVGVGTTFWIEFPIETLGKDLAPAPAQLPSHSFHARTTGGPSEPVVPESTGIKVLYVEDNPVNMDLVVLAFERHRDLELLTATNAMRGLEIARTQRPDVILMDIRLPEMNGIEALEVLRGMKQTRKIPVIAVTAHAMEAQREAGMEAGFDAYLTKPLDIPELLKAVRQFARVSELQ
jgi:CheY-like chemotaxis protein/anti-sigma regulatory factor (Ser/Thr protein kinase)